MNWFSINTKKIILRMKINEKNFFHLKIVFKNSLIIELFKREIFNLEFFKNKN